MAVLSDDPSLYKKFASPGAFDGAKIECPWETLRTYQKRLEGEGCDLVIPLQHLYEHEDQRTLEEFDFPVVLSGHDHHKVRQAGWGVGCWAHMRRRRSRGLLLPRRKAPVALSLKSFAF